MRQSCTNCILEVYHQRNTERFVNSPLDFKGTNFEYNPFGAGRRMCPGIAFALPNVELPLAMLLYHFDRKRHNGMKNEEFNMSESFGFSLRRKKDLCLALLFVVLNMF